MTETTKFVIFVAPIKLAWLFVSLHSKNAVNYYVLGNNENNVILTRFGGIEYKLIFVRFWWIQGKFQYPLDLKY
jgi:hypothetical protein